MIFLQHFSHIAYWTDTSPLDGLDVLLAKRPRLIYYHYYQREMFFSVIHCITHIFMLYPFMEKQAIYDHSHWSVITHSSIIINCFPSAGYTMNSKYTYIFIKTS